MIRLVRSCAFCFSIIIIFNHSCIGSTTSTLYKDTLNKENKFKFSKKNLYTGGGVGLSFGNVTYIDVSPIIGYRFQPKFSAGVGISYQYYSYKSSQGKYSNYIYGGSVFARYQLFSFLMGHAEYQQINVGYYNYLKFENERAFIPALLLGAGLSQPMGKNASMNLLFLWNVLENPLYPYPNPIIRGGISIGF